MNLIEKLYNDRIDAMSISEKFAITCDLLESVIQTIEHQIRLEDPEVSERELKLRTAEILYLNDSGAQRLIQMAREHGPA